MTGLPAVLARQWPAGLVIDLHSGLLAAAPSKGKASDYSNPCSCDLFDSKGIRRSEIKCSTGQTCQTPMQDWPEDSNALRLWSVPADDTRQLRNSEGAVVSLTKNIASLLLPRSQSQPPASSCMGQAVSTLPDRSPVSCKSINQVRLLEQDQYSRSSTHGTSSTGHRFPKRTNHRLPEGMPPRAVSFGRY